MPCPIISRQRNNRAAGQYRIGPVLDRDAHLRRIRYRAWHRGTRESDFLIGGFFDHCSPGWTEADFAWFEALLDEQDADIIAWVIGTLPVPDRYAGPMMERMRQTDFIDVARDGA